MFSKFRDIPISKYSLYFIFVIATSFYLVATNQSNRKSADSICYIEIAKNFAATGEYISCDGKPLIVWPPLFPTILSFGIEHFPIYIKFLNLVIFLLLIGTWYFIGKIVLIDKNFNSAFALFLSLSTPMMMIATFIWSELLFLLFLSLYLYVIFKYLESKNSYFLVLGSFISVMMVMQRNVGVFLLTCLFLGLFFLCKLNRREKVQISLHYIIPLSISMIWNVQRFWIMSDINVYNELFPRITIGRNMNLVLGELARNLIPAYFGIVGIIVAFILVVVTLLVVIRKKTDTFLRIICSLLLFYVFFWFLVPGDTYEISRYLSVIVPIFYLLIFYLLRQIYVNSDKKLMYIFSIGISLWGIYSILRLMSNVAIWGGIDMKVLL